MRIRFPSITSLSRLGNCYLAETDAIRGADPIEYRAHPQQQNPHSEQQRGIVLSEQGSSQQEKRGKEAGKRRNHFLTYWGNLRCDRTRPAWNQCVEKENMVQIRGSRGSAAFAQRAMWSLS